MVRSLCGSEVLVEVGGSHRGRGGRRGNVGGAGLPGGIPGQTGLRREGRRGNESH